MVMIEVKVQVPGDEAPGRIDSPLSFSSYNDPEDSGLAHHDDIVEHLDVICVFPSSFLTPRVAHQKILRFSSGHCKRSNERCFCFFPKSLFLRSSIVWSYPFESFGNWTSQASGGEPPSFGASGV